MNANRGYVGWSMSVRASEAYEAGEMPKSKWTKAAMLAAIAEWLDDENRVPLADLAKMKKADLFGQFFEYKSWHHTSKHFNVTDFYGLDEYAIEEAADILHEEGYTVEFRLFEGRLEEPTNLHEGVAEERNKR